MAGYTETHIARLAPTIEAMLERRAARRAPPEAESSDLADAAEAAGRTVGRFSLSWSDIEKNYTMLGPQSPLMPIIGWQDDQLDRLLRASAWSWAAVNGNAKAMCQLPPLVQERTAGKWLRAPDDHPLWRFVRAPLGTDPKTPRWGWRKLFYVTALHYYSAGNGYWLPAETSRQIFVTPILTPHLMSAEENQITRFPAVYKMRMRNGSEMRWAPDKIVNIQAPGAGSFWKGASPMQAAMTPIEIDHVATERQRYSLRNQAAPGLTVMSTRPWGNSPKQRKVIHDELQAGYVDMVDHGKPWIISEAQKIERGFSPEELQVFDTKNSSQAEILAVIGIQPSVLGQLDRATYSNTKEATLLWWYGNIQPVLGVILEDINSQLVQPRFPDARIHYQLAGTHIGLQLLDSLLSLAQKYSQLGLATADIGELLDLELPDVDYLKVPVSSWITAGRIEPERIAEVIEQLQGLSTGKNSDPEPEESD